MAFQKMQSKSISVVTSNVDFNGGLRDVKCVMASSKVTISPTSTSAIDLRLNFVGFFFSALKKYRTKLCYVS